MITNMSSSRLLIVSAIALSIVLNVSGCEKRKASQPQPKLQTMLQTRPLIKPPLKWVDLLTNDMNEWDRQGMAALNQAANEACKGWRDEAQINCFREKVPKELQNHSPWIIPLYAGPSKQSAQAGSIRITKTLFTVYAMEYIAPDGTVVVFQPDDSLSYSESQTSMHTVLEEKEGWVLLPKRPFPAEVWMEAQPAQHGVKEVGTDVYQWGRQSIVILEKTDTGVVARPEIPTDYDCEGGAEQTPEDRIKKFSIPWSELYDKDSHLMLKQKYTIC
jgi:hypothetical protein